MPRARKKAVPHLRLVDPVDPLDAPPPILRDPAARAEFALLTQALVDISIEINDLLDGDADLEANGDEFEDSDGI